MAQGSLIPLAKQLIPTNAWAPGVGFKIYTYAAGTLTPQATYQDAALTSANTNPIIVDARGEYVAYGSGTYRIVAKDANDVTIWDRDNVDAGGYNGSDIGTIFQSQVNRVVDSIAALRSLDKSKYTRAFVTGYYAASDGGGGPYAYDPSDTTSTDNGGSIVVASDGGRWKLQYFASVTAKQFGAKADGVINDTPALQKFVDFVTAAGVRGVIDPGSYILGAPLTITIGAIGFELDGPGCNAAIFKVPTTFSGGAAAVKLVGTGNYVGWDVGGFAIQAATPGSTGTATLGFQIGDPTTVAINILGFQFSRMNDVHVTGFAKLWQVTHARMIHFTNCAGWNQSFTGSNLCLHIYQNGAFTGDLLFDRCQFVSTKASGNSPLKIESAVGPYNNSNGFGSVAGIKFRTCDFYAGEKAIHLHAEGQAYLADLWFLAGCQIDQETTNAIYCESKNSGTLVEDLHFDGLYMNKATSPTISFASTGTLGLIKSVWIEQCQILAAVTNAMSFFGSGIQDLHVNDNTVVDCANAGAAIEFNGCTGVKAHGNKLRKGLLNQASYYLLGFDPGTTNIYASGNDAVGVALVQTINDQSGDVVKFITNNPGAPSDPESVSVTASPFTYKNLSGSPKFLSIAGGTVSAITLDGFGLTVTNPLLLPVKAGGTVVVTYSVAPAINAFSI